jgi:predicted glutamate--cysteine ligase
VFPQTPDGVPLFTSHAHHIQWVEAQMAAGTMQNVRHLWTSVRPNGDGRPYDLNRLELRICDLVTDPIALLAITALLEARLLQLMANPNLDPLIQSSFSPEELIAVTASNEAAVATASLDAQLQHWEDGRFISARDWITELYQEVWAIAKQHGFNCFLSPLQKIILAGNEAQQWLQLYSVGFDSQRVLTQAIVATEEREVELENKLCSPLVA